MQYGSFDSVLTFLCNTVTFEDVTVFFKLDIRPKTYPVIMDQRRFEKFGNNIPVGQNKKFAFVGC